MAKVSRARLALNGTVKQRDLTLDEAEQFDAMVAARIGDAIAQTDFTAAPLPDFAAASPDPRQVLTDLASRADHGTDTADRLHESLKHLDEVLQAERPPQ